MNCQFNSPQADPLAQLLSEAQNSVREVAPQWILPRLDEWVVIDIREPGETLFGYLPFAKNVPRGRLEFVLPDDPDIDHNSEILVYSNQGQRSLLAAHSLMLLGFDRVASLDGGLDRWKALELPLE